MANIKQQKKRIGTAQRQRMENLRYRSTVKTLFNRLQLNVDTGDKEAAAKTHKELVSLLDRSITRGSIHRNTAARKKARASRMLLQEAKQDATTLRKAKKKAAPVAKKPKADAKKPAADAKKPAAKKAPAKKAAAKDEAPAAEAEVDAPEVTEEAAAPEAAAEETAAPEAEATEAPAEDAPADEKADDEKAAE